MHLIFKFVGDFHRISIRVIAENHIRAVFQGVVFNGICILFKQCVIRRYRITGVFAEYGALG